MSLIAFGEFIVRTVHDREILAGYIKKQNKIPFYLRIENEVSETTYKVLNSLCRHNQDTTVLCFELNDSNLDNTATKVLSCKTFQEIEGQWIERLPTLYERLNMIQFYFISVLEECKVKEIVFFISEQGYPLQTDCKELLIRPEQFADTLHCEYSNEDGNIPCLKIRIFTD